MKNIQNLIEKKSVKNNKTKCKHLNESSEQKNNQYDSCFIIYFFVCSVKLGDDFVGDVRVFYVCVCADGCFIWYCAVPKKEEKIK